MPCMTPPLHLAFHVAGVDCLTRVLNSGVAQDVHFARLRVDFHIHNVQGEGIADTPRIDRGPSHDGASSAV